jgi:tetratricopeptide (TPR) repeat protein
MTRRMLTGAAVAAIAATAILVGGALRVADEERSTPTGAPTTKQLVRAGLTEQQTARRTGEPVHYTRSERHLRQALDQDPNDVNAMIGLASLANTRHDFRAGLVLARRARSLAPDLALVHGVIGDALIELGRHEAGYSSYERMAELKPSIAAYARVAQAQSLLGRNDAARETLQLALDAAADADTRAWAYTELGRLDRGELRYAAAARQFGKALAVSPGNPLALEALAETEAARGRLHRAIALLNRAVDRRFSPEFLASLGDLHAVAGNRDAASGAYERVAEQEQRLAENGVDTDLDRAMFNLEHGIDFAGSLTLARRGYAKRPGTEANEVLSWALVRNGRCKEAIPYSDRALRFPDGHRYFHRAMIEDCLGRKAAAQRLFRQALDTDPNFSPIWARFAQAQLR